MEKHCPDAPAEDAGNGAFSAEYLSAVRENYLRVVERVEQTKARLGIHYDIKISAATKTVPAPVINYAASLGLACMGENRVQELMAKYDALDERLEKHFIGKLQKNKVKYIVGRVSLIQSVDSAELALEISRRADRMGIVQDVLVEVNIGREQNKSGVMPEELASMLDEIAAYEGIRPRGLMTVAPKCEKKDDYRKFFAETYQILLDIFDKKIHNIDVPLLSMGMSDNYELAIEYGANIIRPGSAIFGARNYPAPAAQI